MASPLHPGTTATAAAGPNAGSSNRSRRSPHKNGKWATQAALNPFAVDDEATADATADQEQHQGQPAVSAARSALLADAFRLVTKSRGKENQEPPPVPIAPLLAKRASAPLLGLPPRTPNKRQNSSVTSTNSSSALGKRHRSSVFESVTGSRSPKISRAKEADAAAQSEANRSSEALGYVLVNVAAFAEVAEVDFGAVAVGQRKTMQLRLHNPSEFGSARMKYEGYTIKSPKSTGPSGTLKQRFKCDLHICVVAPEQTVMLRVTFEPSDEDADKEVVAIMSFMVNDRFKLQCKLTASGLPRAPRPSRFHGLHAFAAPIDTTQSEKQGPGVRNNNSKQSPVRSKKRREVGVASPRTPSRRSAIKRSKTDDAPWRAGKDGGVLAKRLAMDLVEEDDAPTTSTNLYGGSWWTQRKIIYDENWMLKQEQGFTKWMNYVLMDSTAQRFAEEYGTTDAMNEGSTLAVHGGSNVRQMRRRFNFSSLRVLAQKRMESMWSRAADELYHTAEMDEIAFGIQEEMQIKRMQMRVDRPVYADVGLQTELIELLNCYNPVWLCLGLEVVLGHRVMAQEKCALRSMFLLKQINAQKDKPSKKNGDSGKTGHPKMPLSLRRVILNHLIHDQQVAGHHRLVKNLKTPMDGSLTVGSFVMHKKSITGREYFDALMERFILKFLMLVLFLDRAVERKFDKFVTFPCLFRINPVSATSMDHSTIAVTSSQGVIVEFCRMFLSKEGRIDKHLKQLGYVVSYQQTPLDEVDLEVKNLAVDLRDGVRLAKLMETLTSTNSAHDDPPANRSLSSFLRVPALSRLQKVHNVEICLHFLQEKCGRDVLESIKAGSSGGGIFDVTGRLTYSSSGFASLRQKEDEKMIGKLAKDIVDGHREKTLALLWKLISCFQLQSLVDVAVLTREIENVKNRMSFRAMEFLTMQQRKMTPRPPSSSTNGEDEHVYELLLEWCRVVCANYSVEVTDFTSSFADGKVLCYLLHYYHPMLLAKSEIGVTSSDMAMAPRFEQVDKDTILSNEQSHFMLVNERVKLLGEIPVLVPEHYDSQNPPEEKMVVTFVCYLQSRLMDSSKEIHAASRLKRWWMNPRIRLYMRRKKNHNARIIQRFWFTSSQKRLAIRQCRRLLRAAQLVKATVRTFHDRKIFLRLRRSVITLQRVFRRSRRVQDVDGRKLMAAQQIQQCWQKYNARKTLLELRAREIMKQRIARRLLVKSSCLVLERWWSNVLRTRIARRWRHELKNSRHIAAQRIQKCWRTAMDVQRARISRVGMWRLNHRSARVIQRHWRLFYHKKTVLNRVHMNMCATKVKQLFRKNVSIKKEERAAAIARFQQLLLEKDLDKRRKLLRKRVKNRAATQIQTASRQYISVKRTRAAIVLQARLRSFLQLKKYRVQRECIQLLQRNVRVWRSWRQFRAISHFYEMLQAYWRMQEAQHERELRVQRLQRTLENRAAACIQQQFRRFNWQRQQQAASILQSAFRCLVQRKQYLFKRSCCIIIQSATRQWIVRRMQQRQRRVYDAAVTIQKTARMHACFKQHRQIVQAAVIIQRRVRGCQSRQRKFDFYTMKSQLNRLRFFYACWKIELWYVKHLSLQRTRRLLMNRARWTKLSYGIVQKRRNNVAMISSNWRSYRLRKTVSNRIRVRIERQKRESTATAIQQWWAELSSKWEERQKVLFEQRRREQEQRIALSHQKNVAAVKMQAVWRMHTTRQAIQQRKQAIFRQKRARIVLARWLYRKTILPQRQQRDTVILVTKIQSWWRGMLVRLHENQEKVTAQRKKLAQMTLVQETGPGANPASTANAHEQRFDQAQPQTLGGRLEMALHLLLHGKRLQEMLLASHTIEICTQYSRECCRKCVELHISSTIFAAIQGLNRSRPHVELLHQLLLVLVNLTEFESKNMDIMPPRNSESIQTDLRAVEVLVDLMHIHRDMQHIFVLSARALKHYVQVSKDFAESTMDEVAVDAVAEQLREAERRLRGLHQLLARRMALYTAAKNLPAAASAPNAASVSHFMSKINPKAAASVLSQVLKLLEE